MRNIFRMLIAIVATLALLPAVAIAQEGDPVAECEASGGLWMEDFEGVEGLDICHKYGHEIVACEAQGGEWNMNFSGRYCIIDGVSQCVSEWCPEPAGEPATEPAPAEPAPAQPAPSAALPATETAPAQQGTPGYTG